MTDCNQAQIMAIQLIYPQSQVLLCTWYVLHAMQSHFTTNEFPDLWNKIKAWVKTEKLSDFFSLWDEISTDSSVPWSFVQYLAMKWVPSPYIWSKVVQKNQYIPNTSEDGPRNWPERGKFEKLKKVIFYIST